MVRVRAEAEARVVEQVGDAEDRRLEVLHEGHQDVDDGARVVELGVDDQTACGGDGLEDDALDQRRQRAVGEAQKDHCHVGPVAEPVLLDVPVGHGQNLAVPLVLIREVGDVRGDPVGVLDAPLPIAYALGRLVAGQAGMPRRDEDRGRGQAGHDARVHVGIHEQQVVVGVRDDLEQHRSGHLSTAVAASGSLRPWEAPSSAAVTEAS